MAKDPPNVIEADDMVFDFPPEAHVSEINSSSVDAILDQTDTHYILHMNNNSVKVDEQVSLRIILYSCSE